MSRAPIKSTRDGDAHQIRCPILEINSEAFTYWEKNFNKAMDLAKESNRNGALAWLLTVRGSVHITHSDFTLLYPHIASFVFNQAINSRRAIDLNMSASLEFLRLVLPADMNAVMKYASPSDDLLVNTQILERIPSARRPKEKDIAMRLKAPHKYSSRLRKPGRSMERKGLDGDENETWMHFAPRDEELTQHKIKHGSPLS